MKRKKNRMRKRKKVRKDKLKSESKKFCARPIVGSRIIQSRSSSIWWFIFEPQFLLKFSAALKTHLGLQNLKNKSSIISCVARWKRWLFLTSCPGFESLPFFHKLIKHCIFWEVGGLSSTEVAYLLLTQQPQLWLSFFSGMLLRFIESTEAW